MPNFIAQDFLTAFQLRHACCRALLELSRQQAGRIADDNFTELTEILQSKQALIDHLGQLADEQQPLRTAWPLQRDGLSAADRERCESILADTEALLAVLLNEERSSSTQLTIRRDATQRELQTLAVGVQAQEAYASRSPAILSRFDVNL